MGFRINFHGSRPVPEEAEAADLATQSLAGIACGFSAGTRLATRDGWRPVEALVPGDMVLTFDRGSQPIRSVERGFLWRGPSACPLPLWPLDVPEGVLDNTQPLMLLPEQTLLIESDLAEEIYGDPFVRLPASILDGVLGIRRTAPLLGSSVPVVSIAFESPEIVYANGAALVHCPPRKIGETLSIDRLHELHFEALACGVIPTLDDARRIVAALESAQAGAASPPRLPMVQTVPLLDALLIHAA
ncbi:hypothetical protein BV509_16075 [Rhodovulum sulfidophilum]|uniref:Hint domain-containing protein n=1 Tax=Rhodovulum visakhapatnamense TaxID=364297 RepID=A0ABS1RBW5_9RHOB|nr:Hint domain-containing protein [Rhodovulum visakhapatnamense]MBL3568066.1 Hint domain-containing protein [Rhodovulum visakhapatnamense]MBL3577134.1 Hint domain-containing protein [Rhodovulum visakhapatnamense]OLS45712.1 hypothetical protein BV509_16075 [Rhodovulum sulfidophilum]